MKRNTTSKNPKFKAGEPFLTFVTVCKGRLEHLKRSLPAMLQQPGTAIIVVEVECQDGTADWVKTNHPEVTLVRHFESGKFNLSRARNAGLAVVRTPWVFFIDADVVIGRDFIARIAPLLQAGHFHQFDGAKGKSIFGSNIVETSSANHVGGYDAVIEGWGHEDNDFYERLKNAGIPKCVLSSDMISEVIAHATVLRTANYEEKNLAVTQTTNELYRTLKRNLTRLSPETEMSVALRRELFAAAKKAVQRAIASTDNSVEFQMALPPDTTDSSRIAEIEQRIAIRLRLAKGFPKNPS